MLAIGATYLGIDAGNTFAAHPWVKVFPVATHVMALETKKVHAALEPK